MNTNKNIVNIIYFIIICILCIILGSIGYYMYNKSYDSFISFIGMVFLIYACISLSYTLMKKQMYDNSQFSVNLGVDILSGFFAFSLMVYFGIKSFLYNLSNY
jgi:uncharacterized membrane protein YfcA